MKSLKIVVLVASVLLAVEESKANCESCVVPRIGREGYIDSVDRGGKFFFDAKFEVHDWDSVDEVTSDIDEHAPDEDSHGDSGHDEHEHVGKHEGHDHEESHTHNRVSDRIAHLSAGYHFSEAITAYAQLPLLDRREVRGSDVESSEGLGDLALYGIWRGYRTDDGFLGLVGGVKFPTGDSNERDTSGELFSPEIQPGTGSVDFSVGAIFEARIDPLIIRGNAIRIIRGNGDNSYEFGDSTTAALFVDLPTCEFGDSAILLGLDTNYQHGERDSLSDVPVRASGGDILFVGPNLTYRHTDGFSANLAYLLPAYQDRGGDHQDLDSVLMIGVRQSL